MKFLIRMCVLATLTAPILTACQTVDAVTGGPEVIYACVQGGLLSVRPGAGRRHLDVTYHYNNQKIYHNVMQATPSDFGERFRADDGTSFWLNDEKGLFSRPGEDMALCHRNP